MKFRDGCAAVRDTISLLIKFGHCAEKYGKARSEEDSQVRISVGNAQCIIQNKTSATTDALRFL